MASGNVCGKFSSAYQQPIQELYMKSHNVIICILSLLTLQPAASAAESETAVTEGMQRMQKMMTQIEAEQDVENRRVLMREHMEAMHANMMLMEEKDGERAAGMGMGMEQKMEHMEKRMGMMQMMMEQMMQHATEEAKNPAHDHAQ
jgi:hypothetical protein